MLHTYRHTDRQIDRHTDRHTDPLTKWVVEELSLLKRGLNHLALSGSTILCASSLR